MAAGEFALGSEPSDAPSRSPCVCLLIAIPWGCITLVVTPHMQRGSLPQKLRTGWFYAEGACNIFMSYQGAFAFSLEQETIDALNREGIKFFEDIDSEGNRPQHRYFSGVWKETPVSDDARDQGAGGNLYCGRQYSWLWPKGIEEALKQPGSYYQSSGLRGIFVIPKLGLVVASASDR